MESISARALLEAISQARFAASDLASLRAELLMFQRILSHDRMNVLSSAAIRNWFAGAGQNAHPTRVDSLRFLGAYVEWVESNSNVADSQAFAKVKAYIANFAPTVEFGRPNRSAPAGRAESLTGNYQLLRPYAANSSIYVMEPLSIGVGQKSGRSCMMYSHRHPKSSLCYTGALEFVSFGCFAMLTRPHESRKNSTNIRMIGIRLQKEQTHASRPEFPCLSGIMVRATGYGTVARMIVGIPFVAIRSLAGITDFQKTEVDRLSHDIYRHGDFLIGRVDPTRKRMFAFCKAIFSRAAGEAAPRFFSDTCLQTVDGASLGRIINPEAREDGDYFDKWQSLVREDLRL